MSLKGKLSALRFGRGTRQHVFMSAGVVVAAVVLVSFLTWLNDAHKPIVRSIEEAVESSLPEALEQVDDQVATLLGVDEESVRSMRESLAGLVTSRPERILEIATGQPVSVSSAAPAFAAFPTPGAAAPASEEPSSPAATDVAPTQTMSEPSPTTDTPPLATSEPAPPPATDTPPPATEEPSLPAPEEPSPPAEVPSPPATEESPPAAGEPAPPKEEPSPPAKGEQPPATKTSPVPTEGTSG
jgi:hypothetical protein